MSDTPHNTDDLSLKKTDVLISGGGVVGCLAALALAKYTNYKIVLLEASISKSLGKSQSKSHAGFDARVIALASQSIDLLAQLGVDINLIPHHAISRIHVSDRGHLGQVKLDAADYKLDALGKVVAIEALGEYLLAAIQNLEQVEIIQPAVIQSIDKQQHCNNIVLSRKLDNDTTVREKIQSKLLLVSDGGQSTTRELAGFKSQVYDYHQSAIITNILTQLPHNGIAYERFTSQGPIALLPMHVDTVNNKAGRHMSLVWCLQTPGVNEKMGLSEQAFLAELQGLVGYKLGRLEACSKRFNYPLMLSQTASFVHHRSVCIGNAAQSLHPIAGQGFNLGIRDVAALLASLKSTNEVDDIGSFKCMQTYKSLRESDKKMTITATDTLVRVFSNQYLPMVIGRNLGLLGLNKISPLKHAFANMAMGARSGNK